ncbi:MAG: reverse transcriptase family protein [Nitrospiraceae bacterium]
MTRLRQSERPPVGPLVSFGKLEQILGRDRVSLRRFAGHAGRYYRPFDRRRQSGTGKWRHIDNPTDELKELQRRIEVRILNRLLLPETMMGAVNGRSIRGNAGCHLGQSMLVALDLRACFPRTSDMKVFKVYREKVGCSTEIASLLTKLTTFQGRLPQGAPTSATLANFTLLPLHADIELLMASRELQFTFWVDDIVFSGPHAEEAIEPVIRLVHKHGHSLRRQKILVMPNSEPQRVTGVGVNRHVSALNERRHAIRQRIFELVTRESIADHELRSLRGSIENVKWLSPLQGLVLERLAERFLPEVGAEGARPRTDETRPCNNPRRHRWAVTRPQVQRSRSIPEHSKDGTGQRPAHLIAP